EQTPVVQHPQQSQAASHTHGVLAAVEVPAAINPMGMAARIKPKANRNMMETPMKTNGMNHREAFSGEWAKIAAQQQAARRSAQAHSGVINSARRKRVPERESAEVDRATLYKRSSQTPVQSAAARSRPPQPQTLHPARQRAWLASPVLEWVARAS